MSTRSRASSRPSRCKPSWNGSVTCTARAARSSPALTSSAQSSRASSFGGCVRSFIEKAAPLLGLRIDGDLDGVFSFSEARPRALDPFWPVLEEYPVESRNRFTLHDHDRFSGTGFQPVTFLHPGELFFDTIRESVASRFSKDALRGAVFVDPTASSPYFFHLALTEIVRKADPEFDALRRKNRSNIGSPG